MIKLPEPAAVESTHGCNAKGPYRHHTFYYTADQLKQAIRDALEEAAKVCEGFKQGNSATYIDDDWADMCAAAIRKLKEDIQ